MTHLLTLAAWFFTCSIATALYVVVVMHQPFL